MVEHAAVKGNVVASSRVAALLEKSALEELIVLPEQQPEYLSLSQEAEMQFQFQEYQNATKQLSELESLSNELLSNLQELNNLQVMIVFGCLPPLSFMIFGGDG